MKRMLVAGLSALAVLAGGAVTLNATGDNVAQARQSAKAVVDAAKARGEVGEVINGRLEVVSGASADVQAAVREINLERATLYRQLAERQNVREEEVAQIAGEKQLRNAAPGHFVKGGDGQWRRK